MEALNPIRKMRREQKKHMFDAPPYCRKEFPCIPLIDDCLPVPLKLEVSDASRIMYFMENFNGISSLELEFDINTYLKKLCKATDVFIIHLIRISDQGRVKMLTETALDNEIIMPLTKKTLNTIIHWDGENYVCAKELHPDIRKICRKVVGRKGDEMHVIPIISRCRRDKDDTLKIHGNPVALVCLLNCEQIDFFILRATQELFRYCSTTLLNTIEGEEEARLKKNCHELLESSQNLFRNINDLEKLLKEIMLNARRLVDAERCNLFLLDSEHLHWVSKVFSADPEDPSLEVKVAIDHVIPAHVAATGRTLNITNAYEHPLFQKYEDVESGITTRNILCFPIRDEKDLLIGVGQLSNKKNRNFDVFDEQIIEDFAVNCGISFKHSLNFKKMKEFVSRNTMAQNIMLNQITVTMADVTQVLCCKNSHQIPYFNMFEFLTRSIVNPETVCYVLKMFDDLNYLKRFNIRDITLIKFFLTVKGVYRENPYRNWQHGFASGHFVYCLLKQLQLVENRFISPLEGLALLVSSFCHDIDSMGTTNPFLLNTKSVLANFYTSDDHLRTKHSLNQTLTILNYEGCNILEGLNDSDYKIEILLIKDLILSTDMAVHLKLLPKQKQVCTSIMYRNIESAHRYYLCSLLITASDLSDFAKDWVNTKRIIWYILEEFFVFSDTEKMSGRTPSVKGMDREDVKIPELIVEFMVEICKTPFDILTRLFPDLEIMKIILEENIEIWRRLSSYFSDQEGQGFASMDILLSDGLDEEVLHIKNEMKNEEEGIDGDEMEQLTEEEEVVSGDEESDDDIMSV